MRPLFVSGFQTRVLANINELFVGPASLVGPRRVAGVFEILAPLLVAADVRCRARIWKLMNARLAWNAMNRPRICPQWACSALDRLATADGLAPSILPNCSSLLELVASKARRGRHRRRPLGRPRWISYRAQSFRRPLICIRMSCSIMSSTVTSGAMRRSIASAVRPCTEDQNTCAARI